MGSRSSYLNCIFIFCLRFQTMSDQIISRIDDMGSRIDDLEHNINDLMSQVWQSTASLTIMFHDRFQAGQSGGPPALENKDQGDPKWSGLLSLWSSKPNQILHYQPNCINTVNLLINVVIYESFILNWNVPMEIKKWVKGQDKLSDVYPRHVLMLDQEQQQGKFQRKLIPILTL